MRALAATYACKLALAFIAALAAMLCLQQSAWAQDASADSISSVRLEIEWLDGTPGEGVASEVEDAISRTLHLAIMEQLGGSLSRLASNQAQITTTLRNVLDLVLSKRGMKLNDINISPGGETQVKLAISLSGDKLETIAVDFRFPNDTLLLADITAPDRSSIAEALAVKLGGTPISDSTWVEKLIIREVNFELASRSEYAGFDTLVLAIPDAQAKAIITLLPRGTEPLIERYFIKLRSSTMLNMQLADVGNFVGANLESLRGLPVAFVKSKKLQICDYLKRETVFAPDIAIASPEAQVEMFVLDNDISLVFAVESRKFRLSGSGRVDFSRSQQNARLDFTAGLRVSPSVDFWGHGTFFPGEFELRPQAGVGFRYEDRAFAELGYDFKMNSPIVRGYMHILPDFYLSAEVYAEDKLKGENEYGLSYIYRNLYELKIITDFRDELFASAGVRL